MVVVSLALIVVITVADLVLGTSVHLGPLLVVAPALAASVATTWVTAVVAVLAVVDQVLIAVFHGGLGTTNHVSQLIALGLLAVLIVFLRWLRERRERALGRARSVAEGAQRVLLKPPPRQIGPLRVAWLYLTAEDESHIGGDLFAVIRAADPATRVVIGDVRGKGLTAIAEASVVLGAFREGAHRYTLPALAAALQDSVCRELDQASAQDEAGDEAADDLGEHFVTALVLDLPDDHPRAEMISFGHPSPLLVHDDHVTILQARSPAPPLGLPAPSPAHTDRFPFDTGDMLVLYTDGVVEARSPEGEFYPLVERVAALPAISPEILLHHIHRDLLDHTDRQLADDAALLIIERLPANTHRHTDTNASPI